MQVSSSLFLSVRAGDGWNGYDNVVLDASTWRGEGSAPEINVAKSAIFNELERMHFDFHI